MAARGSAAAAPPLLGPAEPTPAPSCAQCGGEAKQRCGSCRGVFYCGRTCSSAAWPEHKRDCKRALSERYGGKQLASERDFVLEYWQRYLPSNDAGALLPSAGEQYDDVAVFKRCRAAAMDAMIPGFSRLSEGELDAALYEVARDNATTPHGTMLAMYCIALLCPAALGQLLAAGAKPGHVVLENGRVLPDSVSLLHRALLTFGFPYAQSSAALLSALASLRMLLAHAQPSDWLVGPDSKKLPLYSAAGIRDPSTALAVLEVIMDSPGGFPAHAVAASPGILHLALQMSTASFVEALLAAGADPAALVEWPGDDGSKTARPLHALAIGNVNGDARDFGDKLRLLLDAGADLEASDGHSRTALQSAAFGERLVAFDALLAAGACASSLRTNYLFDAAHFWTVLHQLAWHNNAALITRVLAAGELDVDVRTGPAEYYYKRCTPLHIAAERNAPRAVAALLAAGASLTATNASGVNALQEAILCSSAKAARLLVEATPRAAWPRYKREAALARARATTAAQPGNAAAAAKLAAAREIAALLA